MRHQNARQNARRSVADVSGTGNGIGGEVWQKPFASRFKRYIPALLLFLFLVVFCLINGGAAWLRGALGFRDRAYDREEVIRVWKKGEMPEDTELLPAIELIREEDGSLRAFSTGKQALGMHTDKILTRMLCDNYDYYAGNSERLAAAQARYPSMHLIVLIPEGDLETVAYRWFGGAYSMSHENRGPFVYLASANAYTTAAQIRVTEPEPPTVQRVEETAHTWRVYFSVRTVQTGQTAQTVQAGGTSGETANAGEPVDWCARFIKREDGTAYLESLTRE